MTDAMKIAAFGLQGAAARFDAAAGAVVQSGLQADNATPATPASPPATVTTTNPLSGDTASAVVSMMEAQASFGASLAVFKTADSAYRKLLDTLA